MPAASKQNRINPWTLLVLIVLASIACGLNQFKVPPVMSDFMVRLDIDMATAGWASSVYALTIMILIVPGASFIERVGLKKSALTGLAVTALASLAGAFTTNFAAVIVLRALEGVGHSLFFVIAPIAITQLFDEKRQGLPMGIWNCSIPLAVILVYNIAVPIKDAFGVEGIWIASAALLAVLFVATVLLFPADLKAQSDEAGIGEKQAGGSLSAWTNLSILLVCLVMCGSGFRDLAYSSWAPTCFTQTLGVSEAYANFAASVVYIGMATGSLISGTLLNRGWRLPRLLLGALVITFALTLFCFNLPAAVIMPFMFVLGLTVGTTVTCVFTGAARYARNPREIAIGSAMVTLFCSVGQLLGAPAAGAVIQSHGWLAATLVPLGGCIVMLACAVVLLVIRRGRE